MDQKTRIGIGLAVLVILVGAILAVESWRNQGIANQDNGVTAGGVAILIGTQSPGYVMEKDLPSLEKISFTEPVENKLQEGWYLADIIRLYVDTEELLGPEAKIVVSSSSRNKTIQLTWAEVDDPANLVMFDLSNRGTFKLVSVMEQLDEREEWIQDVDRIEIFP